MTKRAFTFPGQGSQAVGMGRDLAVAYPEAKAVFDEVDAAPGQVVISGHVAAVNRAIELCKAAGAKRALPLPVSAPFHCALMRPAADAMAAALAAVDLKAPIVPLVSNVLAQ